MTAKGINDKLIALYTKHLCKFPKDEIEKSFGTDDYSNPLLIHCWEDYTKEEYIRIMYIGRETNSWYSQNPTDKILYDDYGLFDIEQLPNLVVRFDFVYKNQFFYFLHKINKKLNGISCKCGQRPFVHNFIWTNIFKFGRKAKEKGRPKIGVQEWEQKNFNILKDEIKITQPNLIIFVTGKGIDDDAFFIKRVLGDISTTQIDSQHNIVEIQNDDIDIPMYRVLRPEWQKRDTINTIVNLLVNHYNQNYKESN